MKASASLLLPILVLLVQSLWRSCALGVCRVQPARKLSNRNVHGGSQSSSAFAPPRYLAASTNDDQDEKFGFTQRIESIKSLVIGGLAGSVAVAPIAALNDLWLRNAMSSSASVAIVNAVSQWEFDTDMASFQAGLFAICYRYCVRKDENPQLGSGVVAAFALTRTLSRVVVPSYCSAIPLDCKCIDRESILVSVVSSDRFERVYLEPCAM